MYSSWYLRWKVQENYAQGGLSQGSLLDCAFSSFQAEHKLKAVVDKGLQLENRLDGLAQNVTILQEKSQNNQQLAEQAQGKAERATAVAGRLSKVRTSLSLMQVTNTDNRNCDCVPPLLH